MKYYIILLAFFLSFLVFTSTTKAFSEGFENCNLGEGYGACSLRLYGTDYNTTPQGYATNTPAYGGSMSYLVAAPNNFSLETDLVLPDYNASTTQITASLYIYLPKSTHTVDDVRFGLSGNGSYYYNYDGSKWDLYNNLDVKVEDSNLSSEQWIPVIMTVNCSDNTYTYNIYGSIYSGSLLLGYCYTDDMWINIGKHGFGSTIFDNVVFSYTYGGETDTTNYDYTLDSTAPDFATVANQMCFLGEECKLWFSFNELAIGYPMYLINYASSTIPDNAIATTTVTASNMWQNYLIVPEPEYSQRKKYNLLLDAAEYGWVVNTGINIDWMTLEEWELYLDNKFEALTQEYCSEETVCADVATSSDFYYGVECGFKRVICWTFAPSESSKKFVVTAIEQFESSFPFNSVFEIINRTSSAIDEAEASDDTIDFPFIDGEGNFVMIPIVSSSTVPDALGTSITEVNTGLDYFIWLAVGGLYLFVTFKFIL